MVEEKDVLVAYKPFENDAVDSFLGGRYDVSRFDESIAITDADPDHRIFSYRIDEEGDEDLSDYLSEDFQGGLTVAGHQRYEDDINRYARVLEEEFDIDIDSVLVDPPSRIGSEI